MARTTRENKRIIRELEKNQMQLAALQDTAAMTETQAARRTKELQRKLDRVCQQLNLSTVDQIAEFQEAVAANKRIIDDLRSITQTDDLVQAVRELKEASQPVETVSELADQMEALKTDRDALKKRGQRLLKQLDLESPAMIT
jgi:antitoxin component of RelBE/YafQ-DinJ toxin-antitoxin module